MKQYVKNFLASRRISSCDSWVCEWCSKPYAEVRDLDCHHISRRGTGGNKEKDNAENLISLCRFPCHQDADANRISEDDLSERAREIIELRKDS